MIGHQSIAQAKKSAMRRLIGRIGQIMMKLNMVLKTPAPDHRRA